MFTEEVIFTKNSIYQKLIINFEYFMGIITPKSIMDQLKAWDFIFNSCLIQIYKFDRLDAVIRLQKEHQMLENLKVSLKICKSSLSES